MKKKICSLVVGLIVVGSAAAGGPVMTNGQSEAKRTSGLRYGAAAAGGTASTGAQVKVYPASEEQYAAMAAGEARTRQLCDSLGYVWTLGSEGRTGRKINLVGNASPMCGASPAAGTLTLARGLPIDVSAQVNPGCFCNPIHQMIVEYDKAQGLWVGSWYQVGACEADGPVTLGFCQPQ